jgi:hypothetical protein
MDQFPEVRMRKFLIPFFILQSFAMTAAAVTSLNISDLKVGDVIKGQDGNKSCSLTIAKIDAGTLTVQFAEAGLQAPYNAPLAITRVFELQPRFSGTYQSQAGGSIVGSLSKSLMQGEIRYDIMQVPVSSTGTAVPGTIVSCRNMDK